ncbi:MAG: RecX family transcriptional regulator [Bacteroidales bacterium]|nr:RecX family transcriptional regulator [Bacteroidales bacterium]
MTSTEILTKIERYCAYQDRCSQEVVTKLRSWQIEEQEQRQVLQILKNDGFLDDERYVQSFIRGKINTKQWGVQKIRLGLLQKGISKDLIDKYIEDINPQQYTDNIQTVLRKWTQSHGPITQENITKLYRHLMAKGYTYEEIKRVELRTENSKFKIQN